MYRAYLPLHGSGPEWKLSGPEYFYSDDDGDVRDGDHHDDDDSAFSFVPEEYSRRGLARCSSASYPSRRKGF